MPDPQDIDRQLASASRLLDAYEKKVEAAIKKLKPSEATFSEVTGAVRAIADFRGRLYRLQVQIEEQREREQPESEETDPLDGLKVVG